ncbi:MAG TPA: hypothetical protein VHE78_15805 [Gemmatimonadaceae bacterium]|nr:hypothetical protein [Gemmatimonadaceae bacterium]
MRPIFIRLASAIPVAVLLSGCQSNALDVPNLNNPDVARAYSSPSGIESVILGTYKQFWNATNSCLAGAAITSDCINTQAHLMALEGFSELNNFGMGQRAAIPRNTLNNDRGNGQAGANYNAFGGLARVGRTSVNAIIALNALIKASPGGYALSSKAQDARALSFAYFTLGLSLGELAVAYDSAAIETPSQVSDLPPLSGYRDVAKVAILMLDTAIAIAPSANATNGASGFPLPSSWINSNTFTQDQFVRLVKSYRAEIRAAITRTPAERAAADWNAIIADATGGIQADFVITMSPSLGWACNYDCSQMYQESAWGLLSAMIYGMADTSGAYANFIATPFASRDGGSVLIRTPDQRFPQGATRAAQNLDTPQQVTGRRYIYNRAPGLDTPVSGWGFSQYDFRRYFFIRAAQGNGPYVAMSKVEMDMLAAEGYIRAGNFASAQTLIDASRARSGLPSIGTITSASQAIQGGANGCVPQVPQPPGFNTVGCGNIMESMKWEKRMETAFSCTFMCWFSDSRGWGDLPANTALFWAVPYQEMDARIQPFYGTGGGIAGSSAAKGTYGF